MRYFSLGQLVVVLLLFDVFPHLVHAQRVKMDWAISSGGNDFDNSLSISVDANGNVYTVGQFLDTADFDPGPDTFNLVANGADAFIQKLDSNGNFAWAYSFGVYPTATASSSVSVDTFGNVYMCGVFAGNVDFDPGSGVYNLSATGVDGFILKLSSDGDFEWAKSIEGAGSDNVWKLANDKQGNVYVTGWFEGSCDFDPGSSVYTLISDGNADAFTLKLDALGQFVWAVKMGGANVVQGRAIDVDEHGNVYVVGRYRGSADFDPGSAVFQLTSEGQFDVFVLRLNSQGDFSWAKSMGGSGYDIAEAFALDLLGNVYTVGGFSQIVDFDPGSSSYYLNSEGVLDIFVHKLDSFGDFVWAKSFGGYETELGRGLALGDSENLFLAGFFASDSLDFYPDTTVLSAGGSADALVLELSLNGTFLQALSFKSTVSGFASAVDIATNKWGNPHVTGTYSDTLDLDPHHNVFQVRAAESSDFFVEKLSPCTTQYVTDLVVACDSFTWINGVTYSEDNQVAVVTLLDMMGCDSIVSLDLTINRSDSSIDVINTCDSLTWIDGNIYTSNNNQATYSTLSSLGCDSLIRLDLTIRHGNLITDGVFACDSFIWIDSNTYTSDTVVQYSYLNSVGCDSIIELDLTVLPLQRHIDTISVCDSLTWSNGVTYVSSGYFETDTLINSQGCDSILALDLTVTMVNTDISLTDSGLTASEEADYYQWFQCSDEELIVLEGSTGRSFSREQEGYFAVVMAQGQCTDTSECHFLPSKPISHPAEFNCSSIFPNPMQDAVVFNLGSVEESHIRVYTSAGQLVFVDQFGAGDQMLQFEGTSGTYILEVVGPNTKTRCLVIKE